MSSSKKSKARKALTIAGFDPSGGAGIIADLGTFHSLGFAGSAVATAVTIQNRSGVREVLEIPPDKVRDQLLAIQEEGMPGALKTGMLAAAGTVEALAILLKNATYDVLIIDPVLTSSSGFPLLKPPGMRAVREKLLPLATVVTPNILEAEALSGMKMRGPSELRKGARKIHACGTGNVIITGGDRSDTGETEVVDLVYDGRRFSEVVSKRITRVNLHGTGCIYSAALTVFLQSGQTIHKAAESAKTYLLDFLKTREGLTGGRG